MDAALATQSGKKTLAQAIAELKPTNHDEV
jgi:hypothetical protein